MLADHVLVRDQVQLEVSVRQSSVYACQVVIYHSLVADRSDAG
jgi:hypothetical protein